MTIKGLNGESYNVTGNGQGNLNSVLGALGAASFLGLGANSWGGGILGGGNGNGQCSENQPLNRYDAQQMITIANKDSEIALLKANENTRKELLEVYAQLAKKDNEFHDRMDAMKEMFTERITAERESRLISEKEQAVFNQSVTGATATIKSQIAQMQNVLSEITTNVVPQRKVCDTGCCCG